MRYILDDFRNLSDLEDLRDLCYERAIDAEANGTEFMKETTRRQLDRVIKEIHDEINWHRD